MEEKEIEETTKKKNMFPFYLILFLFYLVGIGIILLGRPKEKNKIEVPVKATVTPTVSDPVVFKPGPPSLALSGTLKVTADSVEKLSRYSDDWEKIASPTGILQDEKVKTDEEGKADITFASQLKVGLAPNSEVYFANLLPDSFLVEHVRGKVTYTIGEPVSIKTLATLTLIEKGKATFDLVPEDDLLTVAVATGSAKISYVDNDNETQVYNIGEDETAIYNLGTNRLVIR